MTTEVTTKYPEYREKLKCSFEQIEECFDDYIQDAMRNMSEQGIQDYLSGASLICMIGRGWEPVSIYLEEMPQMVATLGSEDILTVVSKHVWDLSRSPNGKAIPPFMQCLPEASRRLGSMEQMHHFFDILFNMVEETTKSVHGHHKTHSSQGFLVLLGQIPYLLNQLSLEGLKNWIDYGVHNYRDNPERQKDYFSLQSADSKAMLQRERHGTLFIDNERKLDMYMRSMWQMEEYFVPYSLGFDELRKPQPYYDSLGMRIPDVYDDINEVEGINRYRVTLAHMAGHKVWTERQVADNLSPFQRVAVETFEDARIERLIIRQYPGMKKYFLALHPIPDEAACNPEQESCVLHRLALFSRAALDENHGYTNPDIIEYLEKFNAALEQGDSSTAEMLSLAISFTAKTRRQSDLSPKVHFDDTRIDYRDDNRHMWIYIEEADEPEDDTSEPQNQETVEPEGLPPRHYHEWDYHSGSYKPDWVTLYESLHPPGRAADIDAILEKHSALANYLKRILDLLKPQQYVRIRYQEEGSELDLDVAIRSLIDFKSGSQPDPRINMSHKHDGRDIAVLLLMDLSASLHEIPEGCSQSILELSREAVTLLGWSIEQLGDKFAIAGFHSDTRHNVRYHHIKGFSEHWDDGVKSRLSAIEAGYSTRMGAAVRHASHYLQGQKADKKLLLILTDGEPADIDVTDDRLLIEDAHKAVEEVAVNGIYTHCISLDKKADDYIADIFGDNGYTVIDHVEKLPEKLPKLFMSLTT